MATLGAYSTSGDGFVRNTDTSSSWATLRAAATGTGAFYTSTNTNFAYVDNQDDGFARYIDRSFFAFDTSGLTSAATVTAATFKVWVVATPNDAGVFGSLCLVGGTQASTSSLATTDFGSCGTTELATRLAVSGLTTGAYNTFTLNSSGIAAINKTGYTKLCIRHSSDLDNSAPTTYTYCGVSGYYSDQTGTSNDPALEVTYTLAGAAVPTIRSRRIRGLHTR